MTKGIFASHLDLSSVRAWSGTPFHIRQELELRSQLRCIQAPLSAADLKPYVLKWHLTRLFSNKNYQWSYEPALIKKTGKRLSEQIKNTEAADFIFSIGNAGCPLAHIKTNLPKVFWTDACFAGLHEFYSDYSNLCQNNIRQAQQFEQDLLDCADAIVYSSEWAASTAILNYKVNAEKVAVIPFASNLDVSLAPEEVNGVISKRSRKVCKLLFIGVDWKRKGGPLVLEIASALGKMNVSTELHVIGRKDQNFNDSKTAIVYEGFLQKDNPEHKQRLIELLQSCHFLLLPARAEAFGCVLAEAASFALPSFATNVGGIPTAVKDQLSGILLPPEAGAEEFATQIKNIFLNEERYLELAKAAHNEYLENLNWSGNTARLLDFVTHRLSDNQQKLS